MSSRIYKSDMLPGVEFGSYNEAEQAERSILDKKAVDDLAAILGDKNTMERGDRAIESTGRQLSALPPPPIVDDGKLQAKGFFLNDADAAAISGAERIKSDPAFTSPEERIAMLRTQAPDVVENFQTGLDKSAGVDRKKVLTEKTALDIEDRQREEQQRTVLKDEALALAEQFQDKSPEVAALMKSLANSDQGLAALKEFRTIIRTEGDAETRAMSAEKRKLERERLELARRDLERKIKSLDDADRNGGGKSLSEKYGY